MGRKCAVNNCHGLVQFQFPVKAEVKDKWLSRIRRPGLICHKRAGLCPKHFKEEDFLGEGYDTGCTPIRRRLKKGASPSVALPGALDDPANVSEVCATVKRFKTAHHAIINCTGPPQLASPKNYDCDLGLSETPMESINAEQMVFPQIDNAEDFGCSGNDLVDGGESQVPVQSVATQTAVRMAPYTICDFMFKPDELCHLTGIRSYERFMSIFYSLGPLVSCMEYRKSKVQNVSVEDQFFMVLWKLRKATSDFELGMHFGVHHTTVGNIVCSFIKFAADKWSKLNIQPSRKLVDYYMLKSFKKMNPSTQVITETYKSFPSYQEIAADIEPQGAAGNSPACFRLKDHFGGVMNVSRTASKRVHIERLIGRTKRLKILRCKPNTNYVPLWSDIFYVCVMLTLFSWY